MEKRAKVGNAIQLPMTRQDIADYLGLKIETVCRILTSLKTCAAIEIPTPKHIVLRNHCALRAAMEDRSNGALSNSKVAKNTARKGAGRRRRLMRTSVQRRVPSEAV